MAVGKWGVEHLIDVKALPGCRFSFQLSYVLPAMLDETEPRTTDESCE